MTQHIPLGTATQRIHSPASHLSHGLARNVQVQVQLKVRHQHRHQHQLHQSLLPSESLHPSHPRGTFKQCLKPTLRSTACRGTLRSTQTALVHRTGSGQRRNGIQITIAGMGAAAGLDQCGSYSLPITMTHHYVWTNVVRTIFFLKKNKNKKKTIYAHPGISDSICYTSRGGDETGSAIISLVCSRSIDRACFNFCAI